MKRSWMGFVLLLVLLAAGLVTTREMVSGHEAVEENLDRAAACALLGDWEGAQGYFDKAEADWQARASLRACLADHGPAEEIDAFFSILRMQLVFREASAFTGGCLSLARQVAAVGEAHGLNWRNLL